MSLQASTIGGAVRKLAQNAGDTSGVVIKKKKKTILDEDSYVEGLQKIIQRDFFPDLPRWKAQAEYFDAIETNDLVKLREIQMKYGLRRPETGSSSVYSTPATFETPEPGENKSSPSDRRVEREEKAEDGPKDKNEEIEKQQLGTLDNYLAKNTSEDNASFSEILKETQRKHREKHAWLYEREERQDIEHKEKLTLPDIEKQAVQEAPPPSLHTWQYSAKNSLMYVPDGAELSAQELIEKAAIKRDIVHDNTRFNLNPFNSEKNKEILQQVASEKAHANLGKIGHDGKEIHTGYSPRVNGYGFVKTPSPMPGMCDESPMMTWGEIEGTPFRLDGTDNTPLPKTPGPTFKIPELPKRDRIALELAERASKAHRIKKQDALRRVTQRLTSPSSLSPHFGMSATDKLNHMSPAAQRLASHNLSIKSHTDKALRASYSPSPLPSRQKSPSFLSPDCKTPGSCSFRSNSSGGGGGGVTPDREVDVGVTGKHCHQGRVKNDDDGNDSDISSHGMVDFPSLTDNLLNLPRRKKAMDFF